MAGPCRRLAGGDFRPGSRGPGGAAGRGRRRADDRRQGCHSRVGSGRSARFRTRPSPGHFGPPHRPDRDGAVLWDSRRPRPDSGRGASLADQEMGRRRRTVRCLRLSGVDRGDGADAARLHDDGAGAGRGIDRPAGYFHAPRRAGGGRDFAGETGKPVVGQFPDVLRRRGGPRRRLRDLRAQARRLAGRRGDGAADPDLPRRCRADDGHRLAGHRALRRLSLQPRRAFRTAGQSLRGADDGGLDHALGGAGLCGDAARPRGRAARLHGGGSRR